MFVRVKDQNGTEALVTLAAFELVHKANGFTLVEDQPEEVEPKSKSKRKDSTK